MSRSLRQASAAAAPEFTRPVQFLHSKTGRRYRVFQKEVRHTKPAEDSFEADCRVQQPPEVLVEILFPAFEIPYSFHDARKSTWPYPRWSTAVGLVTIFSVTPALKAPVTFGMKLGSVIERDVSRGLLFSLTDAFPLAKFRRLLAPGV